MLRNAVGMLVLSVEIVCALALAGGCSRSKPQPPAAAPVRPAVAVTPVTPIVATDADSRVSEKSEEAPTSQEGDRGAPASAAEPSSPAFAAERIILLVPGNPIVVEFQLSIDG